MLILLYPFFLPAISIRAGFGTYRAGELPAMMTLLLGLCLLVLLVESQGPMRNTKLIALLGVLVAINSALRFIETAIPGPGGFTPVFFLIILVGYVFGGRVGFLMEPHHAVCAGDGVWVRGFWADVRRLGGDERCLLRLVTRWSVMKFGQGISSRINPEILVLAVFGFLWGFLYGAIMNLWQWPFIMGPQAQSWMAGLGITQTLQRYLAFYLVTSLVWDAIAALGNAVLMLAFGAPALKALRRFQNRFTFNYVPEADLKEGSAA
jgi:energy-coupling factor transport system substrate-specific component